MAWQQVIPYNLGYIYQPVADLDGMGERIKAYTSDAVTPSNIAPKVAWILVSSESDIRVLVSG